MKKILLMAVMATSAFSTQAAERRYAEGYNIAPSHINTKSAEGGLSLLDNKLAFSRNDTVYAADLNDSLDLKSITPMNDLSKLGIEGQFAQNGKTIVFSKGGELYSAELVNKSWSKPQKLKIEGFGGGRSEVRGSSFATRRWTYKVPKVTGLYNPAFSKNGKRLYYVAELDNGMGGKDIWYSDKKADGKTWTAPANLTAVNTKQDEDFPFVAGDTAFYYCSAAKNDTLGGMNIYKTNLKKGKPEVLAADFNSNSNDGNFVVFNGVPFLISNRNGNPDIFRPELIKKDTVKKDTVPTNIVRKDYNTCIFYFAYDKTTLIDSYDEEFEYINKFINEFPNSKFTINGHTDARGEAGYNLRLSENRAKMVYDRLINMGVSKSRLTYKGYGKSQLDIKNATTEEEHQKNRRVEIIKLDK